MPWFAPAELAVYGRTINRGLFQKEDYNTNNWRREFAAGRKAFRIR
jgi:hypothetical protein